MHAEHIILLPVYKSSYFAMSENISVNIKLGDWLQDLQIGCSISGRGQKFFFLVQT
jgi:hypothetical protein